MGAGSLVFNCIYNVLTLQIGGGLFGVYPIIYSNLFVILIISLKFLKEKIL